MKRIISLFVIISLLLLSVSCAGNDDHQTRSKGSIFDVFSSDDDSSKAKEEEESSEEEPQKKPSEGLDFASNGDGTCYVSGIGSCTDTDIIIPSVSPDGDKLTGIGEYAFRDCSSVRNITIPDSVPSIGIEAFRYCSNLTDV